jgi:hypothetical protein
LTCERLAERSAYGCCATAQRTADAAASLPSDHAWPDAPDYGELREHDEADFADGRMLAFGGMGRI